MVGPRRSRSIFQDLRRFQFHCQSRHYGGQQKQKVRTVFECQYHHITVAQKRKSDLSFSVSGQIEGERGGGSLLMKQLLSVLLEFALLDLTEEDTKKIKYPLCDWLAAATVQTLIGGFNT